jgi:hypothetical protein
VTKRYDEPIDVVPDPFDGSAPGGFSWRGRTYQVDERLTTWREAGEYWNASGARDREYFRVLARPLGAFSSGEIDSDGFLLGPPGAVYDVYRDRIANGWRLARVWD